MLYPWWLSTCSKVTNCPTKQANTICTLNKSVVKAEVFANTCHLCNAEGGDIRTFCKSAFTKLV